MGVIVIITVLLTLPHLASLCREKEAARERVRKRGTHFKKEHLMHKKCAKMAPN